MKQKEENINRQSNDYSSMVFEAKHTSIHRKALKLLNPKYYQ